MMDLDKEVDLLRYTAMEKKTLDIVDDDFIYFSEICSEIQKEMERLCHLPKGEEHVNFSIKPKNKNLYEGFWQKIMYCRNEMAPIVIYGAGKMGTFIADVFISNSCNNIVALCDNGADKTERFGLPIMKHNECTQRYPDAVYVITVQQKYIEIIDNLLQSGIPRNRITVFDRLGNRFIYNP